jgi:hypothetical protein
VEAVFLGGWGPAVSVLSMEIAGFVLYIIIHSQTGRLNSAGM